MLKIHFPDGSSRAFESPVSGLAIAQALSPSLTKRCIAIKVDGVLVDLNRPIDHDSSIQLITDSDPAALEILRHSAAHLLAEAIRSLYPEAKFGVGPAIEEGFYYDIDLGDVVLTESDLPAIEKQMLKIANENRAVGRRELPKAEALELFAADPYKIELIKALPDDEIISVYAQGDFTDLCRGPHLPSSKWLRHFKLTSLAGAYWRGDSKNKQLTRVYGTAFFTAQELADHLLMVEERKKRDHRKLGKELDLFMLSEYGPGFPFWLPKGMILRRELENFWYKVHVKEGYQLIQTPIMLNKELWVVSGHWLNYRENMYTSTIDDEEYAIKPMNC
ncbi:MAG: TGS domain-containing protein, partial [bacterium]